MAADPSSVALDTSAAIPLIHRTNPAHARVLRAVGDRVPVLTGHSLAETYSVLTRAPGALRLTPLAAADVLERGFGTPVCLSTQDASAIPRELAGRGISGGAVYDALVAVAAATAGLSLITRDARATATYAALGARVEVVTADH